MSSSKSSQILSYLHFILKIILYLKTLISLRKIPAHLSRCSSSIPTAFPFVDCLISQYFSTQVTSPSRNYFYIWNLLPPWPDTHLRCTLHSPDGGASVDPSPLGSLLPLTASLRSPPGAQHRQLELVEFTAPP